MITIYVLHYREADDDSTSQYYFTRIDNIVEFLNTHVHRRGLEWQTVVAIELDSNARQPVHIPGYPDPCNTFGINKRGQLKPLNVHNAP